LIKCSHLDFYSQNNPLSDTILERILVHDFPSTKVYHRKVLLWAILKHTNFQLSRHRNVPYLLRQLMHFGCFDTRLQLVIRHIPRMLQSHLLTSPWRLLRFCSTLFGYIATLSYWIETPLRLMFRVICFILQPIHKAFSSLISLLPLNQLTKLVQYIQNLCNGWQEGRRYSRFQNDHNHNWIAARADGNGNGGAIKPSLTPLIELDQ